MTGDEGCEGGVEKEALTLVGEAPGVGDRGKRREATTQEVNVRWPRPPVVEKLTTGPLGGFRQAEAVHVVVTFRQTSAWLRRGLFCCHLILQELQQTL